MLTKNLFIFLFFSWQDPRHFVYGSDGSDSFEITDMNHSLSTSRTLQLYNRASSNHLRILPMREIDAKGEDGDEFGKCNDVC